MIKIELVINDMMCVMCERHINSAISESFKVKSVTSSHDKKTTEIITQNDIPDEKLVAVIEKAGHKVNQIKRTPVKKKGLFGLFGK